MFAVLSIYHPLPLYSTSTEHVRTYVTSLVVKPPIITGELKAKANYRDLNTLVYHLRILLVAMAGEQKRVNYSILSCLLDAILRNQSNNSMVNLKQFKPKIVRNSKMWKL